jgi:arylsulfatase
MDPAERPNLVLILTDHWRGDCLGRLHHPVAETPHLDSLSLRGTTFTRAYSPSPSCIPARRCLMSGQTPATQGVVGFQDGIPWDFKHTLPGELQKAGYQTISVGKTHFYPDEKPHLGYEQLITKHEYDAWLAAQPFAAGAEHDAHGVYRNSWSARPHFLPEQMMRDTWMCTQAIDRLQNRDTTRPYFITLSFNGPHPPWCPPQVYYDQFIHREMPKPIVGAWAERHAEEAGFPLDVDAWRGRIPDHLNQRARAAYFAYLAYLDAQIGRFLLNLPEKQNTFVLMSSDHGEMLGDHHLWRKTYAYEASARVPFLIRPPAAWDCPRNVEVDQVVGWEDIMPTLLEAGGAEIPDTVEGRSVLPLLHGKTSGWREFYHGEHSPCYHIENANQFLTDGHWKYIWNTTTGAEQLFCLDDDPHECHELAAVSEHQKTLALWRGRLVHHLAGREEGISDGKKLIPKVIPAHRGGAPREFHTG